MHRIISLVSLVIVSFGHIAAAQPEIGKPVPGFTFNKVKQFKTNVVTEQSYRGKWLYLDFWYRGCVTCIRDIPKTNKLYAALKKDMNFLTVVGNSKFLFGQDVESLISRIQEKYRFAFPYVLDSLVIQKWQLYSFPHIVVVDPLGIVRIISGGDDISVEKLQALIRGESVEFNQKGKYIEAEKHLVQGTQLTLSRKLSRFTPDYAYHQSTATTEVFQRRKERLFDLFQVAVGADGTTQEKIYPNPYYEISDTSLFVSNHLTGEGYYDYQLVMERSVYSEEKARKALLTDLELYTGVTASLEIREVTVLALTVNPSAIQSLKTKGGTPRNFIRSHVNGDAAGFKFQNFPMSSLRFRIAHYWPENIPIVDETDILENIDLEFDALMTDMAAVMKELNKHGFNLIRKKKEMQVIVLKPCVIN